MSNTTVKLFHNLLPAAPALIGAAGSMITLLDACLVNGFGLQSAGTTTVANGEVTMAMPNGHSFEVDTVIEVAGASLPIFNTQFRVTFVSQNTVKFKAPAGAADGTVAGTLTAKIAPAGWSKVFSDTNVAVYRSNDPMSARMFYRVNDASNTDIRINGYENMTDAMLGSGQFPTTAQISGGSFWPKANAAGTQPKSWTLIADSRTLYFHNHPSSSSNGLAGPVYGLGDFESVKAGDAYAAFVAGAMTSESNNNSISAWQMDVPSHNLTGTAQTTGMMYAARSFSALGSSTAIFRFMESFSYAAGAISGGTTNNHIGSYPNTANSALILSRCAISEWSVSLRGFLRGFRYAPQNCQSAFNRLDRLPGSGPLAGRTLVAVKTGVPIGSISVGVVFFDITGPWG